jgi:hypothetical protein
VSLNLYSELPHVLDDKDCASVLKSINVIGFFFLVFLSPALYVACFIVLRIKEQNFCEFGLWNDVGGGFHFLL